MKILKAGDLVKIDDLLSPYYGQLAMVVDIKFYNEKLSNENPGTGHPDSYSCNVILHKSCKTAMIRARFLEKL
jgi:hypothetical protein